ncbi:MAG TPA: hypothetical protein VGN57_02270 [Pirellulaceae bacterium]|nr:hypothetical protein [Pirellulaceae bacterium]
MRAKFVVCSVSVAAALTLGCSGAPESAQVRAPKETTAVAPKESVAAEKISPPPSEAARSASSNRLPHDTVEYFPPAGEFTLTPPGEALSTPATEPAPEPEPLQSFRPEDGSFEVLFPTEPETATETLQDGGKLAIYRSAASGVERQVSAFDLPETMTRESAEATLQSVAASIIEAAGGFALEQTVVAGLKYPAVRYDYAYEAAGERFRTAGILAMVDSRQFQASVLATEEAWDQEASLTFLESFRPSFQTPTLTAPQFSGPKVSAAPQAMKVLPASSPKVETPSPEPTPGEASAAKETAPVGVERRLPWVDATVVFPAEPETLSDEATADTDRMFHAFAGAQSFSVTLHREDEALPIEIAREILAATAEAIATSVEGQGIVSEAAPGDEVADHRLSYRYAGDGSGPVQVRQRLLFVDAVQVYLIVAGPVEGFDEATAEKFLTSWSLAGNDAVAEGAASGSARAR